MGNKPTQETRKKQLLQLATSEDRLYTFVQGDMELRFGEVIAKQLNWSLLHLASWHGNCSLIQQLCQHKFDLNFQDVVCVKQHGNTALHLAQLMDQKLVCKYLDEQGAKSNIKNKQNKTASEIKIGDSTSTLGTAQNLGLNPQVGELCTTRPKSCNKTKEEEASDNQIDDFRRKDTEKKIQFSISNPRETKMLGI